MAERDLKEVTRGKTETLSGITESTLSEDLASVCDLANLRQRTLSATGEKVARPCPSDKREGRYGVTVGAGTKLFSTNTHVWELRNAELSLGKKLISNIATLKIHTA